MAHKVVLLTTGTLGDVRPFVALGLALDDAGYDVKIGVPENFLSYVRGFGLNAVQCGGDTRTFVEDPQFVDFIMADALTQLRTLGTRRPRVEVMYQSVLRDAVNLSADADILIAHPLVLTAGDIAEARGIPTAILSVAPVTPTKDMPMGPFDRSFGSMLNTLSFRLLHLQRRPHLALINALRKDLLGLAPSPVLRHPYDAGMRRLPVFYAANATLFGPHRVSEREVRMLGAPLAARAALWTPSPALEQFLSAKPAPIYLGFGSMPGLTAEYGRIFAAACVEAGVRAVIGKGWSQLESLIAAEQLHDRFHIIAEAPHEQLFPRVSAVVHHGGCGTTHTGLVADRPTLICPFVFDQHFYGHRAATLGTGPLPLPVRDWSVPRLAVRLTDLVDNPAYRVNAAEVGKAIRSDTFAVSAVAAVADLAATARSKAAATAEP